MAITFRGYVSGTATGSSDVTLDLTSLTGGTGSAAAEDDIVLVLVGAQATAHQAPSTSGYTSIVEDNRFKKYASVHRKLMGATPDTEVVINGNTTEADGTIGLAVVYSGVDTTTPMDVAGQIATNGGGDPDPPSITTVTDGAFVVAFGYAGDNPTFVSGPSGYTEREDIAGPFNNLSAAADLEKTTAGVEDPGVFTTGGGACVAATIALRPGPSGPADMVAAQGSYTLTGQAANLNLGFTMEAAQGSYTLTGQAVDLLTAQSIVAEQGSYVLTGQIADLLRQYPLLVDQGSYVLTGQDADLDWSRSLVAEQGSYTLSGQVAGFEWARVLIVDSGSYTLSGQDAELIRTYPLVADQGSYGLTGNDIILIKGVTLTAEQGSYVLTGNDAELLEDLRLVAESGSYTLTGNDATLQYIRFFPALVAETGFYTLTGNEADLTFIDYNPGRFNQWYTTISITLGIT